MNHLPTQSRLKERAPGFTLIELVAVIVIMGIISATVLPALGNIQGIRAGAARDDLVRFLEIARGRSIATGDTYGVQIDLAKTSLSMVKISTNGSIQTVVDPTTNTERKVDIGSIYSGVTINRMYDGNGSWGSNTIWFDETAQPHKRSASGAFVSNNPYIAVVMLCSGSYRESVFVYPYSGATRVDP